MEWLIIFLAVKILIIAQIEKMDVSQFEQLAEFVIENYGEADETVDYSVVLTCNRCEQEYGGCPKGASYDVCEKRFRDSLREV